MSPVDARTSGSILTLFAAVSAAGAYLFASAAVQYMDPLVLGVLEFSIATLPAALWALSEGALREVRELRRAVWYMLLLQVVFTFGAIFCLWTGLQLVTPTTASLLNRIEIVFTVILGVLLFRERHRALEWAGGALAFLGVLVLRWDAPPELARGSLWILGSAACFAGAEIVAKWLAPQLRASAFLLLRTPMMALLFGLVATTVTVVAAPLRWPSWPGLSFAAGVALCGPILARSFYYASLRRIPLSRAALLNQTQPVFVAILSAVFLGVFPNAREWSGGAIVLAGILVLLVVRSKRSPMRPTHGQEK